MTDARFISGISACDSGRYEDAVRDLEPALEVTHASAQVLVCLGRALFQTGAYDRSVLCWERLLERAWSPETDITLRINRARASYMAARSAVHAGRFTPALSWMKTYGAMYPGEARARTIIASLQQVAALQGEQSALDAVRRSVEAGEWASAADRLMAVQTRLDTPRVDAPDAAAEHVDEGGHRA